MLFNDDIRNILITGGSGGIGLAVTRQLLDKGHRLFVTTRDANSERAARLAELQHAHTQQLQILEMDIGQEPDIQSVCEHLQTSCDGLHLVFNCSGLLHDAAMQPEKRLEDLTQDRLQRSFLINSIGPMLLARYALPLLKHDETSVFANMSARVGSISDNRIGGWYGYRAAKAAQNMATKTIAIELKRRSRNTIVVGLHPGTVDTDLSRPFQSSVKPGQLKTPMQAAAHLLQVIDGLSADDSGKVFAWDGTEIAP